MDRRAFVAGLVALFIPAGSPSLSPREFYRYDRARDRWEKIDPHDMRRGDVVWVRDPGGELNEVLLVSHSDAGANEFFASHRVDPKTNQWVPV